jgi:hypothetical protein
MMRPEAYEQACLDELTARIKRSTRELSGWKKRLTDLSLEGRFPDTRLVVRFHYEPEDREIVAAYPLWEDENLESPSSLATLILANVGGPGLP